MSEKHDKKTKKHYILSDILFKKIYGQSGPLTSLLKAFFWHIHYEEPLGEIQSFKERNLEKTKRNQKDMRTDILVYTNNYIIILEAYTHLNMEGLLKAGKYVSKIDGEQLQESENYIDGRKVILIIIADHVSSSLNLEEAWCQKYNYKGEKPKYNELPLENEIFILRVDKLPKVGYYDARNDLLLKHLRLMKETSQKIRKQIAREDEDLMTIAMGPTTFMHDESMYKYYNAEVKAKAIAYGDGKEEGRIEGRRDEKIEIAKSMLEETPELGMDKISKITGLTIEKINQIKEDLCTPNVNS